MIVIKVERGGKVGRISGGCDSQECRRSRGTSGVGQLWKEHDVRGPTAANKVSQPPPWDGRRSKCKRECCGVHGCGACIMQAAGNRRTRNIHGFPRDDISKWKKKRKEKGTTTDRDRLIISKSNRILMLYTCGWNYWVLFIWLWRVVFMLLRNLTVKKKSKGDLYLIGQS